MFKKFSIASVAIASALCLANLPVKAQGSQDERWMTMGKTNTGSILSLDIYSVQTKPHTNNWLRFSYRVTDDKETRERIGSTGTCAEGRVSGKAEWVVDTTDTNGNLAGQVQIQADSAGSQALLKKVCQLGSFTSKYSPWVVIGKTSTGETLSLDLFSVQFTGYGEATVFNYKFTGRTTSRINKASTESCDFRTGQLNKNASLGWSVYSRDGEDVEIFVEAESQASKEMLERVCYQALVMFQRYGIQN